MADDYASAAGEIANGHPMAYRLTEDERDDLAAEIAAAERAAASRAVLSAVERVRDALQIGVATAALELDAIEREQKEPSDG